MADEENSKLKPDPKTASWGDSDVDLAEKITKARRRVSETDPNEIRK